MNARVPVCLALALAAGVALGACVPSPTATPPRQTPFPTLPVAPYPGDTPAPLASVVPPLIQPSTPAPGDTRSSISPTATSIPLPTFVSAADDARPPIVQLTVQDPELPVSLEQAVPVTVLAADDRAIVRLDLYDNDLLYAQAPALAPAPVYSHHFAWRPQAPGRHTLRAIALDASGNASAPAALTLNVITDNRAPAVLVTAPLGLKDAQLGAAVLIQGVATDDVAVTRIELLVDNELVTFVTPEQAGGVTPYAVALAWTPTLTGLHNLVLRAYDNRGQSDDSLRTTVRVFDNQPPVVTADSARLSLPQGDALVVHALAVSNNGIARIELYVDDVLAATARSSEPALQTAFAADLAASAPAVGAHTFFARAFDAAGLSGDSLRVSFTVRESIPRVVQETPAPAFTRTPMPPFPSPTPALDLPDPPTVELALASAAPVFLPRPAQIRITARGSTELDHIELWARYPGEDAQQLLLDENVQGLTDRTLTYDWPSPRVGVVELVARIYDKPGQTRQSAPLRFEVRPPLAPTPTPAVYNFAQVWFAESSASRLEVTFTQFGSALRGTFVERRVTGESLTGEIVTGAVTATSAFFGVDFRDEPLAGDHTLAFECGFTPRPPQLTCNYTNEKGERGSAILAPLQGP